MKVSIIAGIIATTIALPSLATELETKSTLDKSGFGLHVGMSSTVGFPIDLQDQDSTSVVLGGSYTFESGWLVGGNYIPNYTSGSYYGVDFESSAITAYVGKEGESGVKWTAGAAVLGATASNSWTGAKATASSMGAVAGVGYVFDNRFTVDAQSIISSDGVNVALTVGRKF